MKQLILAFSLIASACAELLLEDCEVAAKIDSGYVCGRLEKDAEGADYASFTGIPYAKQPLGRLRFQELQPLENFTEVFNARELGPICPQVDVVYGPLLQPRAMGEDCIRINVYAPIKSVPELDSNNTKPLLPIFMWIHGGSFSYGSGDSDLHGPQYLMTKNIIFVTFNYRLNALGFLYDNSKYIPGNNGLRDALTALRWLQRNAKSFGGDPAQVTLGGQSAGGVMAHILSISPASKGLFKRVIALSGQAIANFYSYSKVYSQLIAKLFLTYVLGLGAVDTPEGIHEKLIALPIEKIIEANKFLLDQTGLVTFAPVIETPQPGFTTVLSEDPETLLSRGSGKTYPLLLGFTNNECQTFVPRLTEVNIQLKFQLLPILTLPMNLLFSANPLTVPILTAKVLNEYFNNTLITLKKFLPICTDSYYKYSALRLTEKRLASSADSTYLYEFGYGGENSTVKQAIMYDFPGAGHIEDITYFFRVNSVLGPLVVNELNQTNADSRMKDWMTTFIANFVKTGKPVADQSASSLAESPWSATSSQLNFQRIEEPQVYNQQPITPYLADKKRFFDELFKIGRGI